MSDPSTNSVLEQIATNFGGGVQGGDVKRPQIEILQDIAKNTAGGGGGGPGYDDTAIKNRMTAVESKNSEQDSTLAALTDEDGVLNQTLTAHGQTLNQLTQSIQTANDGLTAVGKRVTSLELYHSSMIVPWADSRGAQNWNNNTVPYGVLARSPLYHMEMLGQRVRVNVDYMQAVSGDDIDQLYTRMLNDTPGQYAKYKPSEVPPCIAWLQIGTNQVNKGTALQVMLDKLNLVIQWLLDHGHKVMLLAEWPRGAVGNTGNPLSADNEKLLVAYHNALLKIRKKNVWIVDVWPRVVDPTSPNSYPLPLMMNVDTLHNGMGVSPITAQEAVRVMIEEMNLPRLKITTSSNADLYDAVIQPQGCLNNNPMLQETVTGVAAGTLGTNATGKSPAGYQLSASGGLSVVGSFVSITLPDGSKRKAFRMVVSGTTTGANAYVALRQSGILSKIAVNDILEGNFECVVTDGHVNFANPGPMIDTGNSATRSYGGLSLTGDQQMAPEAVRGYYGVPRCPDLAIGATLPASISYELRGYFTASGVASSATIDFLSSGLRKKKQ